MQYRFAAVVLAGSVALAAIAASLAAVESSGNREATGTVTGHFRRSRRCRRWSGFAIGPRPRPKFPLRTSARLDDQEERQEY